MNAIGYFFTGNSKAATVFVMVKFSIITVTYNAAAYLSEALLSVAQQNYSNYEHILWDGGSTDNTLEIASCFPHVKIYQGQDEGISDAMNRGAAMATGDFLLHLHADDLLAAPYVLSMVATTLTQHPQIDWLYGRAHILNDAGKIQRTTPFEPYHSKRLRKYNFITHPATFVKRAIFERVEGFQSSLRYCMDYDLWLRLAMTTHAFPVSAVLACFREHPHSLSTRAPLYVTDEAYQVRNCYVTTWLERYRSYRIWKKRRRKGLEHS